MEGKIEIAAQRVSYCCFLFSAPGKEEMSSQYHSIDTCSIDTTILQCACGSCDFKAEIIGVSNEDLDLQHKDLVDQMLSIYMVEPQGSCIFKQQKQMKAKDHL